MSMFRSERAAAVTLIVAAILGLTVANSAIAQPFFTALHSHFGIPGTSFDISVSHLISDGFLAIFFFVVAVELRHEFTSGELNSVSRALRPAITAVAGVLVPALAYLVITAGTGLQEGWPIPTATDIAFALGILAIFGKGIPARVRIFLLAVAIIDDIIAIIIIAIFFSVQPDFVSLGAAAVCVAAFGVLSRYLTSRARVVVAIAMVVIALAAWVFTYASGIHATIAGVALGLLMTHKPALRARHALEPVTNGLILPLFAFAALLVPLPSLAFDSLSPAFWGIVVALPLGKLVGLSVGAWATSRLSPRFAKPTLSLDTIIMIAALGGIGFTVSLLMNELAFERTPEIVYEGTLAVLVGSLISVIVAGVLVSRQAIYYRRLRDLRLQALDARS